MSSKPIADQIAVRLMQKFYLDQACEVLSAAMTVVLLPPCGASQP
jgi:hypothetical protein